MRLPRQTLTEFHVDGFRVDLTTAIHRDHTLQAYGRRVPAACQFGMKFLREWTSTLRLIKPRIFLIAEDNSGWSAVTQRVTDGGLGFDAVWDAQFCNHLIGGASSNRPSYACLIKMAGLGDNRPLAISQFAGALASTENDRIVYNASHENVGNMYYGKDVSARTIVTAVNGAQLVGETRRYAEARVCFAVGMTLLSNGTPMFFMGEEVGASIPYRYMGFLNAREDYFALRQGAGQLFSAFTPTLFVSVCLALR